MAFGHGDNGMLITHNTGHDNEPGLLQDRQPGGYEGLCAAVVLLAVRDLESGDWYGASNFIMSDRFEDMLFASGVRVSADECRQALHERGLL